MLCKSANLVIGKMNAMGKPSAVIQPTHLFKIINRTETKSRQAKFILVMRFSQMRMQPAIMLGREFPAGAHQGLSHRKW